MSINETDRRVQRTRALLQQALMELIAEKGYDAIKVRDITDRANLGRTTFYMHYRGKADLFLSAHQVSFFKQVFDALTYADLLAEDVSPGIVAIFEQAVQVRSMYHNLIRGMDASSLNSGVREQIAASLEIKLRQWFNEQQSTVPFAILTNYLAGAQLALVSWWLESPMNFSAQQVASAFHQLQRAALREALRINAG